MKQAEYIDDLMINAFVDGQLDVANCEAVLAAMEADPETRRRVFLVPHARNLMRIGFANAQALSPIRSGRKQSCFRERRGHGLAAALVMLSLGFGSGVLGYLRQHAARTWRKQNSACLTAGIRYRSRNLTH
jgi:anti-sigma factor RsiW